MKTCGRWPRSSLTAACKALSQRCAVWDGSKKSVKVACCATQWHYQIENLEMIVLQERADEQGILYGFDSILFTWE